MIEIISETFNKEISTETVTSLSDEALRFLDNLFDCLTEASEKDRAGTHRNREMLRAYLRRFNLNVDSRLLFNFAPGDEFEIWSLDHRFLGCSGAFVRMCSYTLPQILQSNWDSLFKRDQACVDTIFGGINRLFAGEPIIENVTPWHLVQETNSKHLIAVELRVKSMSLAKNERGEPAAFVAITNVRKPLTGNA